MPLLSTVERDARLAELGRDLVKANQAVTILSSAVTGLDARGRDSAAQLDHLHEAERLLAALGRSRRQLLATIEPVDGR
jgi:hypothetical protein